MTKRELLSQVSALETEYSAVLAASSGAADPVAHLQAVDAKENELKAVREQLAAVDPQYPIVEHARIKHLAQIAWSAMIGMGQN